MNQGFDEQVNAFDRANGCNRSYDQRILRDFILRTQFHFGERTGHCFRTVVDHFAFAFWYATLHQRILDGIGLASVHGDFRGQIRDPVRGISPGWNTSDPVKGDYFWRSSHDHGGEHGLGKRPGQKGMHNIGLEIANDLTKLSNGGEIDFPTAGEADELCALWVCFVRKRICRPRNHKSQFARDARALVQVASQGAGSIDS